MSLGATASAPASTWLTAVRASRSSVSSFATSPSRSTPQCPWLVYSQRQTSVTRVRPRRLGPERVQRALHDAVVVPGARPLLVLLLRDPEEQDGANAELGAAPRPRARPRRPTAARSRASPRRGGRPPPRDRRTSARRRRRGRASSRGRASGAPRYGAAVAAAWPGTSSQPKRNSGLELGRPGRLRRRGRCNAIPRT